MHDIYAILKRHQFFHDSSIESPLKIANKVFVRLDDVTFQIDDGKILGPIPGDFEGLVVMSVDATSVGRVKTVTFKLDDGSVVVSGSGVTIFDNKNDKPVAKGFG